MSLCINFIHNGPILLILIWKLKLFYIEIENYLIFCQEATILSNNFTFYERMNSDECFFGNYISFQGYSKLLTNTSFLSEKNIITCTFCRLHTMFISNTYLQFYTTKNVDIPEKLGENERGSKCYFRVLGPCYSISSKMRSIYMRTLTT